MNNFKSISSKKKIIIFTSLCLLIIIVFCFIFHQVSINSSANYTLVGDGYIVQVNKKQFDEFGTGEFADLDLDRFAEHYGLEKISLDDKEALTRIGYEVSPAPPKANQ